MIATGAKPMGVEDEESAAKTVQRMFNTIAPRYDLLNHVLSANVDRHWWWRTAANSTPYLPTPTRQFWISAAAQAT